MKIKILLLIALWGYFSLVTFAQLNKGEDGLYYDENKDLYSGLYIEFNSNGSKRVELPLKNGIKDGEVKLFFEDGSLNEIRSYKEGKMHGIWTMWNEQGTKIGVANYRNNLKDGEWLVWDENGVLRFSMYYEKGKKTGIWKMWDEKGTLISESDHSN